MVRIAWSPEALASLRHIRAYIARFKVDAAERISRDLEEAGNSLDTFPNRGQPACGGMREFATVPPYVLRYRVIEERSSSSGSSTAASAVDGLHPIERPLSAPA